MPTKRIGIHAGAPNAEASLDLMRRAESAGVQAAWLTTGGTGLDALTLFAAAAVQTDSIRFGTSIVPTYPRHPIVVAQQVQVHDQLAPGRLRLGVGPSHRPTMRAMFGYNLRAPLTNLREYLVILRALLHEGAVDFDGQEYTAHASIPRPVDVAVMASALQEGSYELCGELADGAISWVSPAVYLRDKALPAMRRGSDQARRETPPLIAHAPVCISDESGRDPAGGAAAAVQLPALALLPADVGRRRPPGGRRGNLERRDDRGDRPGRRRRHRGRADGRDAGHGHQRAAGNSGNRRGRPGRRHGADDTTAGQSGAIAISGNTQPRESLP